MHAPTPRPAPLVMGIVNVTPDSFSDGGRWADPAAAVEQARRLVAQGARIIDVGGESTRPGSARVDEAEELRRVLPVVEALVAEGVTISVDTTRAAVAAETVAAGAGIVNDVSGGLADPEMLPVVARTEADLVLMHWRGHSEDMYAEARYEDVTAEVLAELTERVTAAEEAGIPRERIVLDPGFGFAKRPEHSWELLAGLERFVRGADLLGCRTLVGTSRKGFLGQVRAGLVPVEGTGEPVPVPAPERDAATAATSLLSAQAGAWAVRVHAVTPTVDALGVHARMRPWQEG